MTNKIKDKDMFKSWVYWRPIVKIVGTITAITLFLAYGSPLLVGIAMLLAVLAAVAFMFHLVGAWAYEDYMYQVKNNYKKLTGNDYDPDDTTG